MKIRPSLAIGDVVRPHKKNAVGRFKPAIFHGQESAIVYFVSTNSTDGKRKVGIENSNGRAMVDRKLLWKTGHNIHWKAAQPHFNSKARTAHLAGFGDTKPANVQVSNNCICNIAVIMNFGCKCGGK